jgi:6-phosphogluconolactonase
MTAVVYSVENETLRELAHVGSLPQAPGPGDSGSDVHISPDGPFVYMSNRGHDSIATFRVTEDGVQLLGHVSTRGAVPRNFCLFGDDTLIVANQERRSLAVFGRDAATGALDFQGIERREGPTERRDGGKGEIFNSHF